jgi:hypothetical protein
MLRLDGDTRDAAGRHDPAAPPLVVMQVDDLGDETTVVERTPGRPLTLGLGRPRVSVVIAEGESP